MRTTRSSITDVYFDDRPSVLAIPIHGLVEGHGVDYGIGANPGDLPGGGGPGSPYKFNATSGLTADSESPITDNGVNNLPAVDGINEYLIVIINLQAGKTFANLISELQTGAANYMPGTNNPTGLRIGLHVQDIGTNGEGSDGFIGTTVTDVDTDANGFEIQAVPVPPAVILAVIGVGAVGILRRRFGLKPAVA